MKIHNIKVRGAIGFKKGLGLDEVELDFSDLSGLIALAGPNGHGKTTLLESLSPFRTFASRTGALRHHFFLRNSFRDLSFEYGGDLYRTLVKVDADSDRSEGFIWKNGTPQVDGKVTQYNNYLVKLLGTANLFYNSVFCAQNSAKLSDMTTGQLKQLFVEFLRLDRLTGYENTTKKCIGLLSGMSLQEERGIDGLVKRIQQFGEPEQELEAAVELEKKLVRDKNLATASLHEANVNLESLKEILAQNKVNIERREDIQKDIAAIKTDTAAKIQNVEDRQKNLDSRAFDNSQRRIDIKVILDKKEAIQAAAGEVEGLERDVALSQEEMKRTEEAGRALVDEISNFEKRQNEIARAIMELEKDPGVYELETQVQRVAEKIKRIEQEIEKLSREKAEAGQSFELVQVDADIRTCRETMVLLEKRDPACQSQTCSFIVAGLKAKEKLPELEKQRQGVLHDINKNIDSIQGKITEKRRSLQLRTGRRDAFQKNLDRERQAVAEKKKDLEKESTSISREIIRKRKSRESLLSRWNSVKFTLENSIKPELETAKSLATQLPQIEIAESRLADLEKVAKELVSQREALQSEREQHIKNRDARISELQAKKAAVESKINLCVETEIEAAKQLTVKHAKEIEVLNDKVTSFREQASLLRQRLAEKESAEKELAAKKAEYDRIKQEIHQWSYLKNACSKTGLQALEIDGVAPLVTGYANDLLTQSFGPTFSVKLVTQDPETGKEVLDIIVIRGDGSETKLENLSGGEKVWILKALRLAMTLVSKEKSGRNFESFFADEEDGPLDSEKAQNFVGLYRSMMDVGKFRDCFYISHNPDVVAMADHRIAFSGEGIRVE